MPVPTKTNEIVISPAVKGCVIATTKYVLGQHCMSEDEKDAVYEDSYVSTWGDSRDERIPRIGKIFSYTFWRTQLNKDVFWSMQGSDWDSPDGRTVISTQYLGDQQQARRFIQEVILTHPYEKQISLTYSTTCQDGLNHIHISKNVINHFKLDDNSFRFEFRLVRIRKKRYPLKLLA